MGGIMEYTVNIVKIQGIEMVIAPKRRIRHCHFRRQGRSMTSNKFSINDSFNLRNLNLI